MPWSEFRRLLVLRMDNIGDVILLGPALRALHERSPHTEITLLASPAGALAAPLLPWIDDVIAHHALWQDASNALDFSPEREQALVETLRARQFDAAVVFTSFSQTPFPAAYACYLAGIPVRVGQAGLFGGGVLSRQVDLPPFDTHQAERSLHLLEATGLRVEHRDLGVQVPVAAEVAASRLLADVGIRAGTDFVALAPGASAAARRYPGGRFAEAARLISLESGLPVVLVGSERDRFLEAPLLAAAPGTIHSLLGRTSVPELAAVLRQSSLVLANNSLSAHLADALRRPVVVTFSGTDHEAQWRPRNTEHRLLRRPTACSPCYAFTCPFDLECLELPPAEVARAAFALLMRRDVPGRHNERSAACAF